MTKLIAQLAKFINMEEVKVAKRQVDWPFKQDKSQSKKGNGKENRQPRL